MVIPEEGQSKVVSSVRSLKQIMTLIYGLSITGALSNLISDFAKDAERKLSEVPYLSWALLLALFLNALRFYHGNSRHLDDTYLAQHEVDGNSDVKSCARALLGFDFFVLLFQSVMFSAMSFYVNRPFTFTSLFTAILVSDLLWVFFSVIRKNVEGSHAAQVVKWAVNNSITCLILFLLLVNRYPDQSLVAKDIYSQEREIWGWIAVTIMLANAVADFVLSRKVYFPFDPNDREAA